MATSYPKIGLWLVWFSCSMILPLTTASNHTRVRRYLNFPKGSSIQLVYCFIGTSPGTEPADIFTIGITVGLAWEIPANVYQVVREHDELKIHARHRKSLYPSIIHALDKLGEDGKTCVLQALCRAASWTSTTDVSFLQLLLLTIFRMPVTQAEDEEHEQYNEAVLQAGRSDCTLVYPCSKDFFSL